MVYSEKPYSEPYQIFKIENFINEPYVTTAYLDSQNIQINYLFKTRVSQLLLNPFHAYCLFLYLLNTSKNLWFSDVFRGYRKRPVT